jgi:hypothetical protein
MGQARDEAGNVWETDARGNPVRLLQPAQTGGGTLIRDPYREAEEERRQQDQEFQAEQLRISQQNANTSSQNAAVTAANANKPTDGFLRNPDGSWRFIPGGPADPAVIAARAAATDAATSDNKPNGRGRKLRTLAQQIDRVEQLYGNNLEGGWSNKIAGRVPAIIRPENEQFASAAAAMAEQGLSAFRVPGVGSQSDAELRQFVEANRPLPTDTDLAIEEKLRALRMRVASEMQGLGEPLPSSLAPFVAGSAGGGGEPPPLPKAAGGGATEQGVPMPPEMQAENEAWLSRNLGTATPQAYAAFRQSLDRKYDFQPAPEARLVSWFESAQRNAAAGGDVRTAIPPATEELSGVGKVWNDVVSHPAGSFATGMLNAGGLGIPGYLADDEMDAMREMNPWSSGAGELVGAVTGTVGLGKTLGAAAGKMGEGSIASLLAKPITADVGYGMTYGATQADDPLYGAVAGGLGAAGGNWLGGQIAKRIPGAVGLPRPADKLGGGERRILEAVNRTGTDPVAAALAQADQLGVPASLADVSPDVNSLTGAALRRSPNAAGQARDILGQRSRGQYDRFLGAVERDLGPVENIPQRSEDLIGQARAQAGPLYEAAYAAPGASSVDLSDLATRPSFTKALTNARRIALEEGRDPTTLGLDLDDAGDVVLTQVPSFQTLDYVKRGLDDVVEGYRDPTTGKLALDTEGRAVNDTLRDFIGRVDTANPDYAAARAAYAGPAAEREAMRRGQEALRMSPNQLGVNVANSSPAQVEQMRLGFQSGLAENAGRVRNNSNPFQSQLDTPGMEQRLSTLYPESDSIARLLAQRDLEAQLAGSTNRLVGNSMTAERQMADEAFNQSGLMGNVVQGVAETAVTGAPVVTALRSGMARGLGGAVRDWRTLGLGKRATAVADEIAPIALNTNPKAAAASLDDLVKRDLAHQEIIKALLEDAAERGGRAGAVPSSVIAAELMR